jgi:hypothetical protein
MQKKHIQIILIVLGVILVPIMTLSAYSYYIYRQIMPDIASIQLTGQTISAAFADQDLAQVQLSANDLQSQILTVKPKYDRTGWMKFIPLLGKYQQDGAAGINASVSLSQSLIDLVNAVEPYADLLGFKTSLSQESTVSADPVVAQSIEDKIVMIADTLEKISPELDIVLEDLRQAEASLMSINPQRYPEQFRGTSIRPRIISVQDTLTQAIELLGQSKPLISLLPDLLGSEKPKQYMLLFQNDGELRPTGGFLTAYAFLQVNKGRIEPQASFDIYDLDARFKKRVPAPDPIVKYLNEKYWNIRNMNLSPDFKSSMDTFYSYYKDIPGKPKPDAIIAIDTWVPVEILKIIGPIGVGGWGNFSAETDPRCDCPQVVYALEDIVDKPGSSIREGRKAVLGPLMHSMMANALGSPKHLWPQLFDVLLEGIKQKHIMFYFLDEENQLIAESFNASGRIVDFEGDYLHINDANLGGAKTDMFITREVEQEITVDGSDIIKTVTVNYNNPYKGSNCNLEAGQLCLNGVYRDWVRFYVPLGSEIISVSGSEIKEVTSQDLGKTTFEFFFTMRPQSSSRLVVQYKVPGIDTDNYRMLIQKQPGTRTVKHTIYFDGTEQVIDLDHDTVVKF